MISSIDTVQPVGYLRHFYYFILLPVHLSIGIFNELGMNMTTASFFFQKRMFIAALTYNRTVHY